MWKWIAEQWDCEDDEREVGELKKRWFSKHDFQPIVDDCFFCDYGTVNGQEGKPCESCPGRLVDPDFDCENPEYDYISKPINFYEKIVALNKEMCGE